MEVKFKSIFKEEMETLIRYQSIFNKKNDSKKLKEIDNYLFTLNKNNKTITEEEFYAFINQGSEKYKEKRYQAILKFCNYLQDINYTNIFSDEMKFYKKQYNSHIYTEEEMKLFFHKAKIRKYNNDREKDEFNILFRLLYATGLRLSEAYNIRSCDINTEEKTINILSSKNYISRRIYTSLSLNKSLINYLNKYSLKSDETLFNVLKKENARKIFKEIMKEIGINDNIKIHALRHTFAVNALKKLTELNIEIEESLLYLQAYMGHSNILSTEYYLHMTENMKQEILSSSKKYKDIYPKIEVSK